MIFDYLREHMQLSLGSLLLRTMFSYTLNSPPQRITVVLMQRP